MDWTLAMILGVLFVIFFGLIGWFFYRVEKENRRRNKKQ